MNYYKMSLWICIIVIEFLALIPKGIKLVDNKFNASGAIEHIFAFIVLYILLQLAYTRFSMTKKILLLFIFAIQLEAIQYFVPSRSVNFWDLVADMFGVMIIILLYFVINTLLDYKIKLYKHLEKLKYYKKGRQ